MRPNSENIISRDIMFGGAKKYVRRMARKGVKQIKKRYTAKPGGRKSTSGVRVGKMAKDIMYLKSVLNPEKKRYELFEQNLQIGQCISNADGLFLRDTTPAPTQGVGYENRNGASIKLHSTMWHFQFRQQEAVKCKIRGLIEIWEVKGDPQPGFTFTDERFLPNPFTAVRDFNCQTNPDNYMKGRCVARRMFSTQTDQLGNEILTTDVKIPIKYNNGQGKHIRWDKNTSTFANGQLLLVVRCDRGNGSPTFFSTLNVPDQAPNTGLLMSYNKVDYYYDN